MSIEIRGACLTDPGRARAVNEDWCGSLELGDPGASVWVVADGVSGFGTGREAAQSAVNAVLSAGWQADPAAVPGTLEGAIARANEGLLQRSSGDSRHASTILAAVLHGGQGWFANVGDCRAYIIRAGRIRQVTRDHTWVAEQVGKGALRPEEAATHPKRNVLTRCLGHRAAGKPDIFHAALEPDDRIVLCSDGLTRHVADPEILRLALEGTPEQAARTLLDTANARGGTDNVTVGVIEVTHATVPGHAAPTPTKASSAEAPSGHFDALLTISQSLNANLDVSQTLQSAMDSVASVTRAERGFIMLADPVTGRLEFQVGRNVDAGTLARNPDISRNIVDRVFSQGQPLLIGDALSDPRFNAFESVVMNALRSVMCAPLIVAGRTIGIAYVDNNLATGLFTQADLDLLSTVAHIAAPAIENARLHDRLRRNVVQIEHMKTAQERVLRSVSNAIISIDRQRTVLSANRAAGELLGVEPERVIGLPLSDLLPQSFMVALGLLPGGETVEPGATMLGTDVLRGQIPGRGRVALRHRLSPLRDERGDLAGYVVVFDDLTELEQLEGARRQARAEREKIERIFKHFMAPAVFDEVMRRGIDSSGVQGDRRELTILFADIRGFTSWAERTAPEEVVEVLNEYLGIATGIIHAHQGTIDKFMGDAILALFGAPVSLPNEPLAAVRAAVAMQRTFDQIAPRDGQWRPRFGIGINTGPGVVGCIGTEQLMSYTVIGDVVNVAARVQAETRAGEIIITGETYERVADHVQVEYVDSKQLKGKREQTAMFKVTSIR
ncbi:MAG: adenylate/guanylate cyclase domain-containing protein [Chloroflexota bacterium]